MIESSMAATSDTGRLFGAAALARYDAPRRPGTMPEWQSRQHLEDHFDRHGHEVGVRTIEEYDARARAVIARADMIFSYEAHTTGEARVGSFDSQSGLFTVTSDDDRWIISHFPADHSYIRRLTKRRSR